MNASEILKKHEDANEMHFHEVDRKWIIQAMEEYANDDRKWVCQKCGELIDGRNVTFEEYHEGCGGRCV